MKKRPRVVVDTNVLISAFAFGGLTKEVLGTLVARGEIWVSPDLLNEYRLVPLELEKEGKINHEQLKVLIAGIAAFMLKAKIIYPPKSISICRDEEDNMILEACFAAKVNFLITGDKDLLEINGISLKSIGLRDLKILTPRDFLSAFK